MALIQSPWGKWKTFFKWLITPKRVPGLSDEWQNLILSIIFVMFLPLLPILLEFLQNHSITEKSLTLAAAMYSIEIGISSRSKLIFGISVAASITFSSFFGFAATNNSLAVTHTWAIIGIGAISLMHLFERVNRHIMDKEPFLESLRH
jgi:hypothetical protein